MELPQEIVLKWKEIFEKDYGRGLSYREVYEAAHNLFGFLIYCLK